MLGNLEYVASMRVTPPTPPCPEKLELPPFLAALTEKYKTMIMKKLMTKDYAETLIMKRDVFCYFPPIYFYFYFTRKTETSCLCV